MNVYPDGETPAFSGFRRCPQADVEGTPCGIAVLKKTFRRQIPRFGFVYLPTLAHVIGVPSTFPRCGGDLLQQEKAFLASVRGDTFDQLLSFTTFRAAGSRPYGDVFGWYVFARGFSFRQLVPPLIHRKRSTITFYGIAATGSYDHFDSLRDAPPVGEGYELPSGGIRSTSCSVSLCFGRLVADRVIVGAVRKACRCEPVTDVTGVAAPRLNGHSLVYDQDV